MTTLLKGKKIGFGITASFCTVIKILEPLQKLRELGAEIYPVISENVRDLDSRFHDRGSFLDMVREISGRDVTDSIIKAEPLGTDNKLDIMIVAPATGNTISKLANGVSDGAVTMASKATLRNGRPLLLALFSNDALGANGINIMKLYNTKNVYFVPFGQDDPIKKPTSMTADLSLLLDSAVCALEGRQIQPSIITYGNI